MTSRTMTKINLLGFRIAVVAAIVTPVLLVGALTG